MRRRSAIAVFVVVIQSILFAAHALLYKTWMFRHVTSRALTLQAVLGVLSVSFVAASLLAFSNSSVPVRALYKASAIWMGLLSFLFLASVLSWLALGLTTLAGVGLDFHQLVEMFFAAAILLGLYGVWNASSTRITRARVRLENLPDAWRGRKAALLTDVHLGHVRNRGFLTRLVAKITQEQPDLIFIAGDLFDGTAIDAGRAVEPLNHLTAPHGVFFVAGNHEQFGDDSKYLNAIAATG